MNVNKLTKNQIHKKTFTKPHALETDTSMPENSVRLWRKCGPKKSGFWSRSIVCAWKLSRSNLGMIVLLVCCNFWLVKKICFQPGLKFKNEKPISRTNHPTHSQSGTSAVGMGRAPECSTQLLLWRRGWLFKISIWSNLKIDLPIWNLNLTELNQMKFELLIEFHKQETHPCALKRFTAISIRSSAP